MKIKIPIACDTGGTFTDFLYFDPDNKKFKVFKISSTPSNPSNAVINGLQRINSIQESKNDLIHGMTIAINYLLERKGKNTVLLTTRGFKDIIEIGRQNRIHLYRPATRSRTLVPQDLRIEINERISATGEVLTELNEKNLRIQLNDLKKGKNIDSIAVCFLFSFLNPIHEIKVKDIAQEIFPTIPISISSEVLPIFREYERTVATVLDAYISPIVSTYLEKLRKTHHYVNKIHLIQSNGGISSIESLQASQLLLSGLAGGILGGRYSGEVCNIKNIISLDIGGTSTDVALLHNLEIKTVNDSKIDDDLPIAIPVVEVKTIGAGGGSIAYYDKQNLLQVGPQSQGADPGPACYSKGGQKVCVTDVDFFLGWLSSTNFAGGSVELDLTKSEEVLQNLKIQSLDKEIKIELLAKGAQRIFHFNVASAIRSVSIEKGYDPREFALVAFGGAGPTHACSIAEILEINRIIIPPFPGCWSAFGLLTADFKFNNSISIIKKFEDVNNEILLKQFILLEEKGIKSLKDSNFDKEKIVIQRYADVRYFGQSYELQCFYQSKNDLIPERDIFEQNHKQKYGYTIENEQLELVNIGVVAIGIVDDIPKESISNISNQSENSEYDNIKERKVFFEGFWNKIPVYERTSIINNDLIKGPCVIEQDDTTLIILKGWVCKPQKSTQHLILEKI